MLFNNSLLFTAQSENTSAFIQESQEETWLKKIQDGIQAAEKIKSSVERNRLKKLLNKILTESEDLNEDVGDNLFLLDYQQIKRQWIAETLAKRFTSAKQNLPEGIDKTLILSILQILSLEIGQKSNVTPSIVNHQPFLDDVEKGRRLYIEDMLREKLPEVKKHLKDFSPSVFISYAWGEMEKPFVKQFAEQLRLAGIEVRLDIWHNGLSTSKITGFVNEIEEVDYIIVFCSELYGQKYRASRNNIASIEARVIAERYRVQPNRILPALLSGTPKESIPTFLRDRVYANFIDPEQYVHQLSSMILALCKYADDYSGLKAILDKIDQEAQEIHKIPQEKLIERAEKG